MTFTQSNQEKIQTITTPRGALSIKELIEAKEEAILMSARVKSRNAKRVADLKQLQAVVEVEAAGSFIGLYPGSEDMPRDVESVLPPDKGDFEASYCYYLNDKQTKYIWMTYLETPLDQGVKGDVDLVGEVMSLAFSLPVDALDCIDPDAGETTLSCSDPKMYCLRGENEISDEQFARNRDRKRIADMKQFQAVIEVEAAGSVPGLYPSTGALPFEVQSLDPPNTEDFEANYCYYVNDDRTVYVISTRIESDDQGGFNNNIDFSLGSFTGASVPGNINADCIDLSNENSILECSREMVYCLQGTADGASIEIYEEGYEPPEPEINLENVTSTPIQIDSDGDGLTDNEELTIGTNPLVVDTDLDGLNDFVEVRIYLSDPLKRDTDGDGYDDGIEVKNGYNPTGEGELSLGYLCDFSDDCAAGLVCSGEICLGGIGYFVSSSEQCAQELVYIPQAGQCKLDLGEPVGITVSDKAFEYPIGLDCPQGVELNEVCPNTTSGTKTVCDFSKKCVPVKESRKIGTYCSHAAHCDQDTGLLILTCDKSRSMCVGATTNVFCANDTVDHNASADIGWLMAESPAELRCAEGLFCDVVDTGACQADFSS